MCHNVLNVWLKTALLLPVWPRDTKKLETPGSVALKVYGGLLSLDLRQDVAETPFNPPTCVVCVSLTFQGCPFILASGSEFRKKLTTLFPESQNTHFVVIIVTKKAEYLVPPKEYINQVWSP